MQFLKDRFPQQEWPARLAGPITGFSAGYGTGRGAFQLALAFQNIDVTAIDLSHTSLTFAMEKAATMGVANIRFCVGDVLKMPELSVRYDIIESSGVIHHMKDPAAGIQALRSCLASDGIMRVALYSDRSRASVVAARDWVRKEQIEDTTEGMRLARKKLRALPDDHPAKGVVDTPEFFVLSGLHDFIFNVQEHRFTPLQIKALLNSTKLTFLGFDHRDPSASARYAAAFPDDPDQINLDNWEVFEQNHPNTFVAMYQFWCRPT